MSLKTEKMGAQLQAHPSMTHADGPVIDGDFTVIVPTLGRVILRDVLAALGAGRVLPASIVLVDQGTATPIEDWSSCLSSKGVAVRRLRSRPCGPAAARNQALALVGTSFFASIDDDCVPAEDWLAALGRRLRDAPHAIFTGRVEAPEGMLAPSTNESAQERMFDAPYDGDPLLTGNFGASLSVANRIGKFDERLRVAEDNDWAYRALRLRIPIIYAPDVRVRHENPLAASELIIVDQAYAFGQGMFMGKHLAKGDGYARRRAGKRLLSLLSGAARGLTARRISD